MQREIHSAPTLTYPSSDGKPMAETDRHRKLMVDFIQMLEHHFREANNIYVSGNLLIYYEEGNPRKSIAPDVFVVFGVGKKPRCPYLTWEEGNTPDFVLEVASPSTYQHDFGSKKELYAAVLAVKEYYIYDPYGDITPSFVGYRLVNGEYQEIAFVDGRLLSTVLDLELAEYEGDLRLYNPATQRWLLPPEERAEQVEAELAKALAELERLRAKS